MQKRLPQMRSGISESRADALDGLRIPAGDIEQLVTTRIGQFLSEPARLFEALAPHVETAAQQRRMLHRAAELAANWPALQPSQLRPMLAALIQRVRLILLGRDSHRGRSSACCRLLHEQEALARQADAHDLTAN
jgi:hypothetical protein